MGVAKGLVYVGVIRKGTCMVVKAAEMSKQEVHVHNWI